MPNKVKICENCGNEYTNLYRNPEGYEYTLPTRFCSKKCASKMPRGCIKLDRGRDYIIEKSLELIRSNGRYTSANEILEEIKCSSKTLTKHRVSITELNTNVGFTRRGSSFEEQVAKILEMRFDYIERQKSFGGLVGKTGHPLRVDFFIPEHNLIIEADGEQHTNVNHPWYNFKNGTVGEYDCTKNTFARRNRMRLIRIPYRERLKPYHVFDILDGN
mgnify:FL=1